jgi:hypothetical protein
MHSFAYFVNNFAYYANLNNLRGMDWTLNGARFVRLFFIFILIDVQVSFDVKCDFNAN